VTDVPTSDAQMALRQPRATLFGGPYDGYTFPMVGFWSEKHALADDLLITPRMDVYPFWNPYDVPPPPPGVPVHHYSLHEGKYYQYNHIGLWRSPDVDAR